MRRALLLSLLAALVLPSYGQEVGSGAPNETVRQAFISAYFRGSFQSMVKLPPLGDVKRLGSTGYVQEFSAASGTGTLALVRANSGNTPIVDGEPATDTFQVWSPMYTYYTSVGATTAGYPTTDTAPCPTVTSNSCTYQIFSLSYALFTYSLATEQGQNFYTRATYYTRWAALGGISGLGPATSLELSATSVAGSVATMQSFAQGAFYNITSGSLNGRFVTVKAPIYALYVAGGSHTGSLGFPTADEVVLPDGKRRQTFERGSIEYTPGQDPVYRYPVSSISLSAAGTSIRMNAGEKLVVSARVFAPNGAELTDRQLVWTTSNSRVATVAATGGTATITAVGSGSASISVTAEGKTASLSVFVTSPCCAVGEGSPTGTVTQAFQDAVSRNRLSLSLPARNPVRRVGAGYVQEFTDASGARVLLAKPDSLGVAFVVSGARLALYEQMGGPAGSLGYPVTDATATGRQLFERGAAMAGTPVRIVSGPILTKWAATGYETGPAGLPVSEPAAFSTFVATSGIAQAFQNATVFAGQAGPGSGKAYLVGGLIAAKYSALGGPVGRLGMPASDEYSAEGRRRQEFEGGAIEYATGDEEARASENPRHPSVTATPTVVVAGSRVRLAAGGFEQDRTLRVSVTGQPDFEVRTQTGAYSWESFVALTAQSGRVTVRAVDIESSVAVETVYTVRALADTRVVLAKAGGDMQVGIPGGALPQALKISVRDEDGNAIAGMPVIFNASPGAQVAPTNAVTNTAGEAETVLRLPPMEGVALATAEANKQVVTFSARGATSSLRDFPRFTQNLDAALGEGPGTIAQKGALLVAAAAAVRYHQNRGELPSANGLADPALLNQFLTSYCAYDPESTPFCDGFFTVPETQERIVNLWRLGAFTGGAVEVVVSKPEETAIRDALAQGSPVILALALTADGAPSGSHFVVATGISSNASIQIHDPSPAFNRTSLSEYLSGFQAGGRLWKGALAGMVRLALRTAADAGFLVASSTSAIEVSSASGVCGISLEFPATSATLTGALAGSVNPFRFRYCEGAESQYQLDLAGGGVQRAALTDLGDPGGRSELTAGAGASFAVSRLATLWRAAPRDVSFAANPLVNAATGTGEVAPGSLVFIGGAGLAGAAGSTKAELNGQPLTIVSARPFQITAQVPLDAQPGRQTLRVESTFGGAEQSVEVREVAPALFRSPNAVLNQDGVANSPVTPARRGQTITVYATGLGAVQWQGAVARVRVPVTALVTGVDLPVSFAGLAPDMPGVYQVNVPLPASTPPGLDLELRLRQQDATSNSLKIAIQ